MSLIPVCCHCYRVRNDAGEYVDIDAGPDTFAPGRATHTICPECLREHYPEYADKILRTPRCGCGKTAEEHDPLLLMYHHYWYIHKEPMKGCPYCPKDPAPDERPLS